MLQFSKVLASLCAGCLCTLTIHQIPALGNVLLPQTHAIPETSPIRPVDVMPLEPCRRRRRLLRRCPYRLRRHSHRRRRQLPPWQPKSLF